MYLMNRPSEARIDRIRRWCHSGRECAGNAKCELSKSLFLLDLPRLKDFTTFAMSFMFTKLVILESTCSSMHINARYS